MSVSLCQLKALKTLKIVSPTPSQSFTNISEMTSCNYFTLILLMPKQKMGNLSGNYQRDHQHPSWSSTLKTFCTAHLFPPWLFWSLKFTRSPTLRTSENKKKECILVNKPQRLKSQILCPRTRKQNQFWSKLRMKRNRIKFNKNKINKNKYKWAQTRMKSNSMNSS